MNTVALPAESEIEASRPWRLRVRVQVHSVPRQSCGRVFFARRTYVSIFGPAGALLRTLRFGERENVTAANVLDRREVEDVLEEFGVRKADVQVIA